VTNFGDYERTFGGLDLSSTMSYAVRDFFLNGGGQAIIVRLYKGKTNTATQQQDSNPPSTDISTSNDGRASATVGSQNKTWQILASSPGTWADGLQIKVTLVEKEGMGKQVLERYGHDKPGKLFSLSIHEGDPAEKPAIETIANVTLVDGPRRLDRVLEQESRLIRIDTLGETMPANNAVLELDGGKDSKDLDAATYLGSYKEKTGLYALEKANLFNLLCIPPDKRGEDVDVDIYSEVLAYCFKRRAMLIVDPPIGWAAKKETAAAKAIDSDKGVNSLGISGENARNAMLYFPRVLQADPLRENQPDVFPACGIVAGIMARTDATRGVWKAPAGLDATLNGIRGLQANLTDAENGQLNPLAINCLRVFPTIGSVLWGARTMRGADQLADEYKYVPVRRLALFIEETLYRSTQWAVFEPNDEPLWSQLRLNIGTFMHDLFRQGAFQGQKPGDAYFVQCDSTTTTQSDINKGIVNIIVGFAPLKPAEFVVIYLQQMAGNLAA
jgi:hypothetical protein